jgi:hypothetical protein
MHVNNNARLASATAVRLSGDNAVHALNTAVEEIDQVKQRSRRMFTLLAMAASTLLYALAGDASAADVAKTYDLRNSAPTAFNRMLSETAGSTTTIPTDRRSV